MTVKSPADAVPSPSRFDAYPTRLAIAPSPPPFLRRRGPAVRGDANDLNAVTRLADAAARFETDGFLALPEFFSKAEAASWIYEVQRLEQWCLDTRPQQAFFEKANGSLRSLFDVTAFSNQFAALARDPRVLRTVAAIIGDEPYLHQARLNYKPAYTGSGVHWHSDFETWHAEDGMPEMQAVSVSIALRENNAFNGPLMLIPGSHQVFIPCIGETPDDHYRTSLIAQRVGTPLPEQLDRLIASGGLSMPLGPAGSVVVFDCNTLHASYNNLSSAPRSNLFLVYNARANALQAPYAARRCRPSFVAFRPHAATPE